MKKALVSLFAIAITTSIISGCSTASSDTGSTISTTASAGSSSSSGEKKVVQFWHSMSGNNGDLTNQLVSDFNSSQNNIEVVATFQGSYAEAAAKAEQAIYSGNAPDILQVAQDNVGRLAMNGQFTDLLPYMKKDGIEESSFVKAFVQDAYYDGALVALPYGRSAQLLHINKTILDEVGASVPTTWEELKETAEKCVIKEGDETKRYGLSIPFDQWQIFAFIQQAGGTFFNKDQTALGFLDDGVGKKVFGYLQDMQSSGALFYNSQSDPLDNKLFTEGMAAMSISSSGSITSRTATIGDKFEYIVAPLVQDKKYSMPTGGAGFGILSAGTQQDAAWEFMKWYVQDEKGGLAFVQGSGYLPFTNEMAESDAIQSLWKSNENYKIAFDALQYGDDSYRIPNLTPVISEFQTCIQAIMLDSQDIEKSLSTFNDATKTILAE